MPTPKLLILTGLAGLSIALASALPASAAAAPTTRCNGSYGLVNARGAFPSIGELRARNIAHRPCLVAESVARRVQRDTRLDGNHRGPVPVCLDRKCSEIWTVTLRVVKSKEFNPYGSYVAKHGDERVSFEGYS